MILPYKNMLYQLVTLQLAGAHLNDLREDVKEVDHLYELPKLKSGEKDAKTAADENGEGWGTISALLRERPRQQTPLGHSHELEATASESRSNRVRPIGAIGVFL